MKRAFFSNESLSDSRAIQTVLHIFSFTSIILGVFWGTYALANGFRAVNGDPFYFIRKQRALSSWARQVGRYSGRWRGFYGGSTN